MIKGHSHKPSAQSDQCFRCLHGHSLSIERRTRALIRLHRCSESSLGAQVICRFFCAQALYYGNILSLTQLPKYSFIGNKRMLSPASPTREAFFARSTNRTTPYLDPNQDIVFDYVVTNIGSGYHGNHGLFVAPVSGVYVFSTTLVSFLAGPGTQTRHAKL